MEEGYIVFYYCIAGLYIEGMSASKNVTSSQSKQPIAPHDPHFHHLIEKRILPHQGEGAAVVLVALEHKHQRHEEMQLGRRKWTIHIKNFGTDLSSSRVSASGASLCEF